MALSKGVSMSMDALSRVVVRSIDDDGKVQIATVEDEEPNDDESDTVEVEIALPYGFSSRAPAGSEALAALVSGDSAQGVATAPVHRDHRPTGLAEGEVVLHYLGDVKLYLGSDGKTYVGAKDATESMMLGDATKTAYDAHTHATPFGPTGAPASPLPATCLSTITKVK